MKAPEINNQQEFFDLNEEDWKRADPEVLPKKGDQIILESMAMPMGGLLDLDDEMMGFKAHYYRGTFIEANEAYCSWENLAGTKCSPHHMSGVRVVPKDRVWEI